MPCSVSQDKYLHMKVGWNVKLPVVRWVLARTVVCCMELHTVYQIFVSGTLNLVWIFTLIYSYTVPQSGMEILLKYGRLTADRYITV